MDKRVGQNGSPQHSGLWTGSEQWEYSQHRQDHYLQSIHTKNKIQISNQKKKAKKIKEGKIVFSWHRNNRKVFRNNEMTLIAP